MKAYGIVKHRINTDGHGVTDLVALSGCGLSCRYCINKKILDSGSGQDMPEESLIAELMQDACYMIGTDGGVTFGGGEPLFQSESILRFAQMRPDWMNINIETSLHAPAENVISLIPYVKQWIVDIKTLDPDIYIEYTGKPIDLMISNLKLLAEQANNKCRIRVPIIPGFKGEETAVKEKQILEKMNFNNIEIFTYTTDRV